MKFDFSLEPVLKVRKHEEKVQKQKLAVKVSEKQDLSKRKRNLQNKLKALLDGTDAEEFENLHDLKRHKNFVKEVHQRMQKLNDSLKVVEHAVNKQRDKLATVHKKRHIMEKLKEEEREVLLEEMARQQRKALDEVATQTRTK